MSLDEFRTWERKCLSEAVTNAARLRSRHNSTAAASTPSSERQAGDKPETTRGADQGNASLKQEG
jgi:hypothetical protein